MRDIAETIALAIDREYGDGNHSFELREVIARSIRAAVEAETDRCAKKASQAVYEALKSRSWNDLDSTHIIISNKVFAAIRAPSVPVKETI